MKLFPFLLAPLVLLLGCKKSDADPAAQLPPATQTGAGTIGCLVNGQPWTPQGSDGTSNYTVSYDRTYHGGNLDIKTYRIDGQFLQYIIFGGDSIAGPGTYSLGKASKSAYFIDNQKSPACQGYTAPAGQYRRGTLTITRLDLQAGVVAGTFAFTLYTPGCDSIRVTQGRFDRKL